MNYSGCAGEARLHEQEAPRRPAEAAADAEATGQRDRRNSLDILLGSGNHEDGTVIKADLSNRGQIKRQDGREEFAEQVDSLVAELSAAGLSTMGKTELPELPKSSGSTGFVRTVSNLGSTTKKSSQHRNAAANHKGKLPARRDSVGQIIGNTIGKSISEPSEQIANRSDATSAWCGTGVTACSSSSGWCHHGSSG